jgi:hypothetical protein
MTNFSDKKFKDLKKQYAYDVALLTQKLGQQTDEELYETLLIFDTQHKIVDAINDYIDDAGDTKSTYKVLITLVGNIIQQIRGGTEDMFDDEQFNHLLIQAINNDTGETDD